MKDINKRQWARLCRDTSQTHLFAGTEVIRVDPDGVETTVCHQAPLLGLTLNRKKGKITAFEVRVGQIHNGSFVALPFLLAAPARVIVGGARGDGSDVIEVLNEDGHRMIMRITRSSSNESYNSLVGEMAYNLSQARGFVPGHELEDWLIAEKLVRKATPTND